MYALKRQFRIWGHEISQTWGRVNFFGRVIIGAAVSLGMAYGTVRYFIKPLNLEINELREGLVVPENLDPEQDEEIIMHLDRAKNLQSSIASWRKRMDVFKDRAEHLDPGVHLAVIAAVQNIMDRCGVRLVSENLYVSPKPSSSRSRSRKKKPAPPAGKGPMAKFTHIYETRASFRQVEAYLLLVEDLKWRVQLRDLALRPAVGGTGQLAFNFKMDIYYLKEKQ